MSNVIKFESGNFDHSVNFPDFKKGVGFSGLTKSIYTFTYDYFASHDFFYTKKENKLIKYDRVTAFRWEAFYGDNNLNKIELMLISPEVIKDKDKILKELI